MIGHLIGQRSAPLATNRSQPSFDMAAQLVDTFENRWDAMQAMHCCDFVGSLRGGDADGGDEKRSGATAAVEAGCMSGLLERVLGDSDHWDFRTESFVQVGSEARGVSLVEPT